MWKEGIPFYRIKEIVELGAEYHGQDHICRNLFDYKKQDEHNVNKKKLSLFHK